MKNKLFLIIGLASGALINGMQKQKPSHVPPGFASLEEFIQSPPKQAAILKMTQTLIAEIGKQLEASDTVKPSTLSMLEKQVEQLGEHTAEAVQTKGDMTLAALRALVPHNSPQRPPAITRIPDTPERKRTADRAFAHLRNSEPARTAAEGFFGKLATLSAPHLERQKRSQITPYPAQHVEDGHICKDIDQLIKENSTKLTAVFRNGDTGVLYAHNPTTCNMKSFFPLGMDDRTVHKMIESLSQPGIKKIASKDSVELIFHEATRLCLTVAATHFLGDIPLFANTVFPMFSSVFIPDTVQPSDMIPLANIDILNHADLRLPATYCIQKTVREIKMLISAIKVDPTCSKNSFWNSQDPLYTVIDLAPFLHSRGDIQIERGLIVVIPNSLL